MSDGIWCVLVFNDDATPMNFVAYLLRQVFQTDADEARRIVRGTHHDASRSAPSITGAKMPLQR
jgi:ATP-dependent Clp protease adapter protein ClpS